MADARQRPWWVMLGLSLMAAAAERMTTPEPAPPRRWRVSEPVPPSPTEKRADVKAARRANVKRMQREINR